ncbi:MAG TPA: hypothetical protein K8V32_00785 [Enteractinococcus helveticum]|uniref:Uncharacterized protein n=1 Tax=Enteractinococcus helveticum TaxID=1837282 RepID=A0A921K6I7_9MICC|nr:hypothetical protein [Enteractinococcus helveticum]HJF13326.1 hypothetical protein [Enteractinococcus helveticum]
MISKRHAALAVLGIVALTACGTTQENAAGDGGEQPQVAQQDSETSASDNSEQQQLGDVTQSMDDALQTITYPMQGHEGEITMGVLAPEVQGDAMLVSIVFEPEFADETTEGVKFKDLHGSSANSVLMPVVSDRENFKAYHVPRETTNQFVQGGGWTGGSFATGTWASAIGNVEVRSGDQYVHWAYFPTPEDDIETVDIAVIPGMQEFRDVTIDWGSNEPASTTSSDDSQDD